VPHQLLEHAEWHPVAIYTSSRSRACRPCPAVAFPTHQRSLPPGDAVSSLLVAGDCTPIPVTRKQPTAWPKLDPATRSVRFHSTCSAHDSHTECRRDPG
jgi:hypothetical protein